MTQKKSYSRYFIILQEDEKGYAVASDKLPSGYAKLEMKNDKCKVSYYVQNLKKENSPYHMLLICNKKDVNKVVKVGELNIDDNGRAEIVHEYPLTNIAGSGIAMDKIAGAAIVRFIDSNIVSVMCGFASTEIPEWKKFNLLEEPKENNEIPAVKTVVENKPVEQPKSIFDKYEDKIEASKANAENNSPVNLQPKAEVKPEAKAEAKPEAKPEAKAEVKPEIKAENVENAVMPEANAVMPEANAVKEAKEEKASKKEDSREDDSEELDYEDQVQEEDSQEYDETRVYRHKSHKHGKDDHPKGAMGEFFKNIIKGHEEVKDFCTEIKRCRWYRFDVKGMQDMMDASDFNKYTVIYYPMTSYFAYINRYGHFMVGYKCDNDGNMKYLVYAIPGTKQKSDQPYGGRSGFVTWVPANHNNNQDSNFGYWLMFYDFRNSTIVIPVK